MNHGTISLPASDLAPKAEQATDQCEVGAVSFAGPRKGSVQLQQGRLVQGHRVAFLFRVFLGGFTQKIHAVASPTPALRRRAQDAAGAKARDLGCRRKLGVPQCALALGDTTNALALGRRIEQQQQKVVNGLNPGDQTPLDVKAVVTGGRFVATLVDVTGLVIYFTVAALLLSGTLL